MLMVGAAGRKAGKTEFACEVLRRYAKANPLIGLKVTAVTNPGECCPRGGEGCGVCGGLTGPFLITEEDSRDGTKDTSRLLAAGASKVLWLRSLRANLEEALAALRTQIPKHVGIVCESNSCRLVLEPGLFIVLRQKDRAALKTSCRNVIHLADRICEFDGSAWDLPPKRVVFVDGRWAIRPPVGAVILAGGNSSRMGQDKSLLRFEGQPMIQRVAQQLEPMLDQVVIGGNAPDKYEFLNLEVIADQRPDHGPLMGIVSCLSESHFDLNFVTGCDIPVMNQGLIEKLAIEAEDFDLVVPRSADGRLEPLFAVYRKSVIQSARAILSQGGRKISDLFERVRVKYVEMPGGDWYRNLNTMEDYREELKRGAGS